MNWFWSHFWNLALGLFFAVIGYFSGARYVIYAMWSAIIFDLITGIWASVKTGRGIKSLKMWRTVYKLFFATAIIAILYMMDKEMGVKFIQFYKLVAWLISGFEIWSILENISKIVDWQIINILKKYMHDRIEDETGINFKK